LSQATTVRVYVFDDFELDLAFLELRKAGERVEVQPKALHLLIELIEQRERVVSNEELLISLWPETAVSGGSIRRAVRCARQALGERADSQSSIRTVRGHGYQFVREVQLVARPQPSAAVADAIPLPAAPEAPMVSAPSFVGREGEMALLDASLQDALGGTTRCVLLTGSPGLGKTRVAEELCARAREAGAHTWLGRCTEVEGVPAFWPFTQILREAVRDRGAARVRALMGREAADIAAAVSELRDVLPDVPEAAPVSTASARFRFFDSMAVFMRRAADEHPIVLSFDDLHHADVATLRLLGFLLRQVGPSRLLIVGTYRRDLGAAPEAIQLLEALTREDTTRCIELQAWSSRELARYIELTIGAPAPHEVASLLHEQTGGNPLFAREVIDSFRIRLKSAAPPDWRVLVQGPETQGLRGAIERHLEVVPEATRELLRAAAVLGRYFSAALLSRISERQVALVCGQLAQAEVAGLVQEQRGDVGCYRFTHQLIRDALYHQLSAARRSQLHGRAGLAIEAQGIGERDELLAEATRHFVLAAPAHDGGRALQYTLRAADNALARLAYEEAATHFERALQLHVYEVPDPRRHMWLLFKRGDALSRTLEIAAARRALFEAAGLAREHGDVALLYQSAVLIASRPEAGSVDHAQIDTLRAALAALPEADDRRVLLQALLAKSLCYTTAQDERVRLATEALARGRRLNDSQLRTTVLLRCRDALLGPEHLHERIGIVSELTSSAQQRGDTVGLLQASAAQLDNCLERGDLMGVEMAVASMEDLAAHAREPFYRWQAKTVRAMQAFISGDLVSAERRARDAFSYGRPISEELARRVYCAQLGAMLRLQGRFRESAELSHEMAHRYPTIPGWVASHGTNLFHLGRRDEARILFDRLMERGVPGLRTEPLVLSGLAATSTLCWQLSDASAAQLLYAALLPYSEHWGYTHLGAMTYGPITHVLAKLAETTGDIALASVHFDRALHSATKVHSVLHACVAAYLHARMLLGRGEQPARARDLLSQALELAESAGMHFIAQACRRAAFLGRAGSTTLASNP